MDTKNADKTPQKEPQKAKERQFVDPAQSSRGGVGGFLETMMRRSKNLLHILLVVPLYAIGCTVIGLAVVPAVMVMRAILQLTADSSFFVSSWAIGAGAVATIFLTGISMMFVLPFTNFLFLFGKRLKPWRGPYYSLEAIRWYIHNGVLYMLRYSFLEFFTPSPMAVLFYRMMGMKIGRGTIINSTCISDPSLITLGQKVTIGGSATIVGHYGQGGYLVLAPVEIGDGATIGLRATVMGGATIGKNARVMAHSVVLPKTQIPEGETWGGVPAQKIG